MTHLPPAIIRHDDHLLVEGVWIDRGDPNKHEPRDISWALTLPTIRHRDHLVHVLRNPGVEPFLDPAELEMAGVEDARNLMHLNWGDRTHDGPCELEATVAMHLGEQPWTGTVSLYGWLESQDRVGLTRLGLSEVLDFTDRLNRSDTSGLPDGEFHIGDPWFADGDQIREQADALILRIHSTSHSSAACKPRLDPGTARTDPWVRTDPAAGSN